MKRDRFVLNRKKEWRELEELLIVLRRTRKSKWSSSDLGRLSRMYRSVCYDLSMVRSREWGEQLENHLNSLVAQGHNFLYRSPPFNFLRIIDFLVVGFPILFRKRIVFFHVALALFLIPFVVAAIVAVVSPASAERVLDPSDLAAIAEMYSVDISEHHGGAFASDRSGMFGFYVMNNVGIAFKCFALGIFFGLGTIFHLLQNGVLLGTITGHIFQQGHGDNFGSFVISHGSFELTGLVIAGMSGLLLAWGQVHPGNRTRIDSLRYHGLDAVKLIAGAGVMLGIAALVEAYFSPLPISHAVKYFVGTALWIFVIGWLSMAGRNRTTDEWWSVAR